MAALREASSMTRGTATLPPPARPGRVRRSWSRAPEESPALGEIGQQGSRARGDRAVERVTEVGAARGHRVAERLAAEEPLQDRRRERAALEPARVVVGVAVAEERGGLLRGDVARALVRL